MSRKKSTIGVAAIAKNEVDRIGRLLKRVDFANEVVVVDSGIQEAPMELRIFIREWAQRLCIMRTLW